MDDDWVKLRRFYDGDESAFSELFNSYKLKLLRLAYRVVHDYQTAEDIAQETLLKVYQKKVQINPRFKFFTWLYRVTLNSSLDHVRSRKFIQFFSFSSEQSDTTLPSAEEQIPAPPPAFGEQLEDREISLKLHAAIKMLPERLRLPLVLRHFEGLGYAEVAQILQITPKAVERRLAVAREKLKGRLKNDKLF